MLFSRPAGHKYIDRGNLAAPDFEAGDLTLDGLWHELDLSGIIPANTKLVFLRVTVIETTAPKQIKFATNGNTSGYNGLNSWTQVAGVAYGFEGFVQPTADRKIQYVTGSGTWTLFEIIVVGYFI